jgi:hypothetical protein
MISRFHALLHSSDPARRRIIVRSATALAAGALLVAMVVLSRDFGATWDERALQKFGEQLWDYYNGRISRSDIDISFGYMRIYGGVVEFISAALQQVIPADLWVVRHGVNAVFGWVGIVFAFLMASRLFGPRAGWLAALLLIAMPRYIGESMNNPKDLPFAVLMLVACYYIVTIKPRYPYVSWLHALKLALTIALALNVRAMGLMALGYSGLALLIVVIASRDWSPAHLAATAGRFAVISVLALLGGSAFWPWAQESPLTRPIEAFFLTSTFNWGNPSLFMGEGIAGTEVPWYYLPTWIWLTVPAVVLIGMLFSLVRLTRPSPSRVQLVAVWAFVLVPATAAIVRHLSLYDGIRHMYFIVPPMAVLAAAGWDSMLASPQSRTRLAAAAALVVLAAEPLIFQVRNHPNQNVYFTPAIGGPRGAFGRFDMDYWGNCVLEATRWAADQADRAGIPVGVAANPWEVLAMDAARYRSLYFRQEHHTGWHLNIRLLKGSRESVLGAAQNPNVLYRVTTADGTPLCIVLPGPEYSRLEERLAHRAGAADGRP